MINRLKALVFMENNDSWEKQTIEQLANASLKEQRTARRWGIFFKFVTLGYLFFLTAMVLDSTNLGSQPTSDLHYSGLVRLYGEIGSEEEASAENIIAGLEEAFDNTKTRGVILHINSPGGSPVQSRRIYEKILILKTEYPNKPIYAVVEDICASGAYYAAVAADKIYVDPASIVGSIGVISNGFGFAELLEKVGVERRVFTAGDDKAFLDPFSELKPTHQKHIKSLISRIHHQFKTNVKERRGDRLAEDARLFSGLIWTGEESIDLGLVDSFGSIEFVAKEIIGAQTIFDFSHEPQFIEKLVSQVGTSFSKTILSFFINSNIKFNGL